MELEASLFATIFSDAVESVSILSRVPQSSSQAASLASSLENAGFSAAASAVEALADAESRFRESVRASGSRRGAAVGTAGDDGTVREAARALARALRARPAAAALVGSGAAGSARMNEFAVTLRALGGAAVARLRTSRTIQDEERAAARHGAERVAQAEAESTRLSAALTAARAADAAEIAEADRLLARVTAELASVHVGAESALKEVKAAASSRLGTVEGKLLAAESASAAMKDKLAAELRAAVDANAEAEAALRKRKTRVRVELEQAQKDYETSLANVLNGIADANAAIEREASTLADLRLYYDLVDREKEIRRLEEARARRQNFERTVLKEFVYRRAAKKLQWLHKIWKQNQAEKKKSGNASKKK